MIAPPMVPSIDSAFSALGNDPFTEENIARHIAPLFSRVLAADRSNNGGPDRIYLENHSLGRAPDQTIADVSEAVPARRRMGHLACRARSLSCPPRNHLQRAPP
jgi:hypothetical protein